MTRHKHTPLDTYVSLHLPVVCDDDGERQLADFLAAAEIVDPVELVVAEDELLQIRTFLAEILSDLEAEVLEVYVQGRSYQDIAFALWRRAKSIDNTLQRIMRKLEAFLRRRVEEAEEAVRVVHVSTFASPVPRPASVVDGAIVQTNRPRVGVAAPNGNGGKAPRQRSRRCHSGWEWVARGGFEGAAERG